MTRPKVLVIGDVREIGLELLLSRCEATILSKPTPEEVIRAVPGQDALLLGCHYIIDSDFLNQAGSQLKVISTVSAGYDHLDVPEIKRRGIKVGHTPQVLSAAVAEIAVLLLLNAARRAHEGRLLLEAGAVSTKLLGLDIRNSTVGIVGLGSIGIEIVKRLVPFGVGRFVYTGHSKKKAGDDLGAEFMSLNSLLMQSDFIVVSTPLTSETRGLFDDATFAKMKKTAVFVNVGRGAVVKTEALLKALLEKKIFAAGVDVIEPEPLPKDHPLLKLPNFEIIPHFGSATIKTRDDMALSAVQNILNGLEGKALVYPL